MAAIENQTPPIDWNLLEEQSCQISPRSGVKRRSLRLQRKQEQEEQSEQQEMCSDMGSVPDQKITTTRRVCAA